MHGQKNIKIYNKCSKIAPTISMHFATRVKIARCSSEAFTVLFADSSDQNANKQFVSCNHPSFVNFVFLSNPTNNNIIELDVEIQTAQCQIPEQLRRYLIGNP